MSEHAVNYEEQIKYLTQLQKVDGELRHLVEQRGNLPFLIKKIDEEIVAVTGKKEVAKQRIEDYRKAITGQKEKSTEAEKRKQQYEEKSKKTKSKQELDLVIEEIELQKIEVLLCEKKIKEHLNIIAVEENKIKLLEDEIEQKKVSVTEKRDLLKKIDEENHKNKEVLETKRTTVSKHILIETYSLYEQVAHRYSNAVVNVLDQSCKGCNILIPLQQQVDIEERERIYSCPCCSRILAYVEREPKKVRRRLTKAASSKKV